MSGEIQSRTFPECAHSVHGVAGRMLSRHCWDDQRFSTQKWVSARRPVDGYGREAWLQLELRFDDQHMNGRNTFTLTADIGSPGQAWIACGCLHEDVARVFPEVAHLIKWHLCSADGPMHYIANTVYFAGDRDCWGLTKGERRGALVGKGKEREFAAARDAAVWPEATDAELSASAEDLKEALSRRLPGLLLAFRNDMEAAGFAWSPQKLAALEVQP